jgi:hypothetical protein
MASPVPWCAATATQISIRASKGVEATRNTLGASEPPRPPRSVR